MILMVLGGMLSYGFILNSLGVLCGILAVVLFPLTITITPFYEAISDGKWLPLIFTYGGMLAAYLAGTLEEYSKGKG